MHCAKCGIPNSLQSPDIGQNSDGYFRFLDFWSVRYKRKLPQLQTSIDIDMKLGPVTKLDEKNTAT